MFQGIGGSSPWLTTRWRSLADQSQNDFPSGEWCGCRQHVLSNASAPELAPAGCGAFVVGGDDSTCFGTALFAGRFPSRAGSAGGDISQQ